MEKKINDLYELLLNVNSIEQMELLFDDLCTKREIENMAERLYAAKLLLEGNTYNQVIEKSNISSATLSRVSRCVQYGKGYKSLIKIEENEN